MVMEWIAFVFLPKKKAWNKEKSFVKREKSGVAFDGILPGKGEKRANMCNFVTVAEKICRINKHNTQKQKNENRKEPNDFMQHAKKQR